MLNSHAIRVRALFVLSACFAQTGFAIETDRDSRPPNIILLFADDQRADTIAAHGNEHISTPNLDNMAREGFSLRQNYCAGSYSGAVCVASRAMLMTGQHWLQLAPNAKRKSWQGLPTLPELLRQQAGYRTHIVGKWHNGKETIERAFNEGSSVFMGGMMDHMEFSVQDLNAGHLTAKRPGTKFSSTQFADSAISFLEEPHDDSPFFLYVAFTAPHDARNPPNEYREQYYQAPPPLPKNFLPTHPFNNAPQTTSGRDESLAAWPRSKSDIRDQLCEYYGLITHLDAQVGRILDTVEQAPYAENTIIIYSADHGLAMGSHGLLGKQNVYEMSMKCPLILKGGSACDVPVGKESHALTYVHDLFATICSLADVPHGECHAQDLSVLWRTSQTTIRETIFLPFQDNQRAIRDERYKLHIYPRINHRLLFDLEADPHEQQNLIDNTGFKPHVTRLLMMLASERERLNDGSPLETDEPLPMTPEYDNSRRKPDRWQPDWIRRKYFDDTSASQN